MNDADLPPPLPASAEALLRSERARPGITDPARDRIAQRLAWAIGGTPIAHLVPAKAPSSRLRWRALVPQSIRAAVASIAVLGPVPLAAAGVGVGSVVGLGLRALIVSHKVPSSLRAEPGAATSTRRPSFVIAPLPDLPIVPVPLPINPSPQADLVAPRIPLPPPRITPAAPTPSLSPALSGHPKAPTLAPHVDASPPDRTPPLATEGVLLDRARSALSRGNPTEALDRIAEHRSSYPEGQLAEERELLSVEAELAAGHVGEARFRAEEFQRRFPHSLLMPRVQAALARLR